LVILLNILASILNGLNGAYELHFHMVIAYYLKIGVRLWLIMDISFISDGWSYSRNPGRIPGRSACWFSATATATSKFGRGYGPANRAS
jgi:hypothetical protein